MLLRRICFILVGIAKTDFYERASANYEMLFKFSFKAARVILTTRLFIQHFIEAI